MKRIILTMLFFALAVSANVWSQTEMPPDSAAVRDSIRPPAPVTALQAKDKGDDHGHAMVLDWELSADDGGGAGTVQKYEILRWTPFAMDTLDTIRQQFKDLSSKVLKGENVTGEMRQQRKELREEFESRLKSLPDAFRRYPEGGRWLALATVFAGINKYDLIGSKEELSSDFFPDYADFYFRVDAITADSAVRTSSAIVGPVQSKGQWFNSGRIPVFFAVILFCAMTIFFVNKARKGADLYVRPLGGIEAVDDAIGRATEMGRPILYVLGLGSAADIATIASFTILGRVAKRVAEYQTALLVPTYDPIVMTVAQEVVKSSYMDAGRPDDYNEDIVHFVTQSQFAYVAAVNGIMLRELPATNVYMGKFFAESLILAETGAVAGSIQIAGTDEIAQIPFFIVACDYTLIGEELYAASAYLGREPILLGSLKAQDWAKAAVIILSIIGLISANAGWEYFVELFKVAN